MSKPTKAVKIQQAINQLKELQSGADIESEHGQADDILCDLLDFLGYKAVVDEYNKVDKWYA